MRLFLCAMLARKPVVSQAIVTGLNGARFFDVYVPELGLELRIQCEDIQPAPVLTDWNKDARCDLSCLSFQATYFMHPKSAWSCATLQLAPVLPDCHKYARCAFNPFMSP